ncbi:MAG: sugar transferase [Acidimicrobiales bacterium]
MKRAIDVAISASALIVASPVIAIVAIVVRSTMGRPVLFRQIRPGLHAELFEMVKFRTMLDDRDESGELLDDDARTHPVGNFLRGTSLDELPTLLNVLRGDMSLVGPRPLMPEYVPRYNAEQARRHEAKPGITGLAQVRGRNTTSWEQRFADDVEYVDSHSVLGDIGILLATMRTLVSGGADALGEDAPGEFWGSEPQTNRSLG